MSEYDVQTYFQALQGVDFNFRFPTPPGVTLQEDHRPTLKSANSVSQIVETVELTDVLPMDNGRTSQESDKEQLLFMFNIQLVKLCLIIMNTWE